MGEARLCEVMQSCLGTVRRGAVTFGEARRCSYGEVGIVRARQVQARQITAVKAVQVVAR